MSHSAKIVKQLHENTERPHRPLTRMLMCYTHKDKPFARIMKMGAPGHDLEIIQTLRWASNKGIEVTFRPV